MHTSSEKRHPEATQKKRIQIYCKFVSALDVQGLKNSPILPSERIKQLLLKQINKTLANTMWFHNLFVCHVRSKLNSLLIISILIVKSVSKKHKKHNKSIIIYETRSDVNLGRHSSHSKKAKYHYSTAFVSLCTI